MNPFQLNFAYPSVVKNSLTTASRMRDELSSNLWQLLLKEAGWTIKFFLTVAFVSEAEGHQNHRKRNRWCERKMHEKQWKRWFGSFRDRSILKMNKRRSNGLPPSSETIFHPRYCWTWVLRLFSTPKRKWKKATLQNGEGKQEQAVAELDNQQEELSNTSIEAISRFAFFELRSK